MSYQLVKMVTSEENKIALLVLTDVYNGETEFRLLDIGKTDCSVITAKKIQRSIRVFWTLGGSWFYIEKEENTWNSPVHRIELDNELNEIGRTLLDIEYFDYTAALSPDGRFLAMGSFLPKDNPDPAPAEDEPSESGNSLVYTSGYGDNPWVNIFNPATMEKVGYLRLENTMYPNGLAFSANSKNVGFISFDQGGGYITVGQTTEKGVSPKALFGENQIRDDYSMSGAVTFDGDLAVVVTCYSAYSFEVVKYNETYSELWKCKIDFDYNRITEDVSDLACNNQKSACVIDDVVFVGGNECVIAIDAKSGNELCRTPVDGLKHIHMVNALKFNNSILCLDIYGNCQQLSVTDCIPNGH